ncbi:MAG: hypothetical protein ACK5Q2_10680, partial [Bacteroidota bacterium]
SSESGEVNYTSTYDPSALSNSFAPCLDSDTDGILDIDDIDDDNDGALDVVESPACYYAAADWNTMDKTLYAQISSELTTVTGNSNFSGLTDNATIDAVQFTTAPAQSQLNKTLFKVTFPRPVQLDALYIRKADATQISGGNVMLQGSNDNSTWTNLFTAAANPVNATNVTANGGVSLANSNKFTVATNAAAYRYYRIYGVAAANVLAGIATEVYFDVNTSSYQASYFPKASCTNDTDGDGVVNQLDSDSDGDGCSDAREAGATTNTTPNYAFGGPYGSNGLDNSLETVTESGVVNYTSTYGYAIAGSLNGCTDTDGDGVPDLLDIDDDNDGVPDAEENAACDNRTFDNSIELGVAGFTECTPSVDGPGVNFWGLNIQPYQGSKYIGFHYPEIFSIDLGSSPTVAGVPYVINIATTVASITPWPSNFPAQVKIYASNGCAQTQYVGTTTLRPNQAAGWLFESLEFVPNSAYSKLVFVAEAPSNPNVGYILVDNVTFRESICDTDGDGIPNSLDTDSDGDGCSDALEAGATTNTTPGYTFTGPYGANGLANSLETSSESGEVNYTSTYDPSALSNSFAPCLDSDTDGILDIDDIDDDNDGA